jgi:hypothetical protein
MKAKISKIYEIKISQGYAYAIHTHDHAEYGSLLRVVKRIFEVRPESFDGFSHEEIQFSCFYPLKAAKKHSLVSEVGCIETPSHLTSFPVFRTGLPDPVTKKVKKWWLWDGEKAWETTGQLTEIQKRYPIRGIWTHPYLVEKIEKGWTPQMDISN